MHWRILAMGSPIAAQGRPSRTNLGRTENTSKPEKSDSHVLELFRLTALIYSDLVIFPVAFFSRVRKKLAVQLAKAYQQHNSSIDEPELELWLLSLGGIASLQTPTRRWYCERLKKVSDYLCPNGNFEMFLYIVRGFLWWDPSASPVRAFWSEVYPEDL